VTSSNASAPELLALFGAAADAQVAALATISRADLRARTDRPGQYALDLVADHAIVPMLVNAGLAVVSEESGRHEVAGATITVVLDPVDGSTNCSRQIPYWAISLCALDADGPLCALVANQATGERFTASRGEGAWVDGLPIQPSSTTRIEDSVIAISGMPKRVLPWKQFRALGSVALTLCDVAAGRVDGYLDAHADMHAPWDYLGGLLVCGEAGAVVVDAQTRPLVTDDPAVRRTLIAAGTRDLVDALRPELREADAP
jgi:fructose-1,6-bisphosphatase/inositol monophosphatase family enzyme